MTDRRLIYLDHSLPDTATEIHAVMMAAYQVEAELLGVLDFAPLRRTAVQISLAESFFLGVLVGARPVAVAELERGSMEAINIASLVVLPAYFRRGLATALLRRILADEGGRRISVSTGSGNHPALALYDALGFRNHRRWTTNDGIPMVTLVRKPGGRGLEPSQV